MPSNPFASKIPFIVDYNVVLATPLFSSPFSTSTSSPPSLFISGPASTTNNQVVANPFGTLPPLPQLSIGRHLNVVDKPAAVRISPLLTPRQSSLRSIRYKNHSLKISQKPNGVHEDHSFQKDDFYLTLGGHRAGEAVIMSVCPSLLCFSFQYESRVVLMRIIAMIVMTCIRKI
ncbi:uncharacterized protein LOC126697360 [Quercus robur]|uniref:uncharacterized protein LOC126697360 n=1 Tax=Quercus robur TaxID=38942 RepID=UPI0021625082|nr:uncharacterized protein LOC126697360 [Quercus robur]